MAILTLSLQGGPTVGDASEVFEVSDTLAYWIMFAAGKDLGAITETDAEGNVTQRAPTPREVFGSIALRWKTGWEDRAHAERCAAAAAQAVAAVPKETMTPVSGNG